MDVGNPSYNPSYFVILNIKSLKQQYTYHLQEYLKYNSEGNKLNIDILYGFIDYRESGPTQEYYNIR